MCEQLGPRLCTTLILVVQSHQLLDGQVEPAFQTDLVPTRNFRVKSIPLLKTLLVLVCPLT